MDSMSLSNLQSPISNLYYNIASHQATIAVISKEKILSIQEVDSVVRDDQLPALVEQVIEKAGLTFSDLTSIACVQGPGGFTSLRVAVTYANVLADQLSIPLAGVHLADLLTEQCSEEGVTWIHSTKKTEVFVRGPNQTEAVHLSIEEALESITSTLWCGELIPEHLEAVTKKGMQEASITPLPEILPSFLQNLNYEQKQIVPWYGRGW